jgi:predicted RNase H-like HicB family nuclease
MTDSIKYEVIIFWSDADDAFIAEVPDLAGCMADGATYEEALANTQVVINQWIETAKSLGRIIPKPRMRLQAA